MHCTSCGKLDTGNGYFCAYCGTRKPEVLDPAMTTPMQTPPHVKRKKPIIPIVSAVSALIVVAVVLVVILSGNDNKYSGSGSSSRLDNDSKETSAEGKLPSWEQSTLPQFGEITNDYDSYSLIDYIHERRDKYEVIVSGSNNAMFTIDGEVYNGSFNLDHNKAVLLSDYRTNSGGVLWFVTPSGATKIAEDVMAFQFSDSGNGIAYFTNYDSNENLATLYLYDSSSKRHTMVTDYAYFNGSDMEGVAISPDGRSVTYIGDVDDRNGDFTGYISIDGKTATEIGQRMAAVAISDSGRHIYYLWVDNNGNTSLHAKYGQVENRLVRDVSSWNTFMLNSDYSQILFSYDGRTYISRNAAERERISGDEISWLVRPRGEKVRGYLNNLFRDGTSLYLSVRVYGISSFSDFVARTSEGLAYYDARLEPNKISGTSTRIIAEISSDGKSLYYTTDTNRLYVVNPTVPDADRQEIDRNVASFAASADGKSVYYVKDEGELFYSSGTDTPRKIADDVEKSSLAMTYSGDRLFFLVDYKGDSTGGDLYVSNNGGARTRIAGANEVVQVMTTPANAFYINSRGEVFRSNGDERFSLFSE